MKILTTLIALVACASLIFGLYSLYRLNISTTELDAIKWGFLAVLMFMPSSHKSSK